ncbi:FMN-binding protein [Sedimentibacter hydroxybenzoicus DSM 7310]|uniref:FMN-binding protein n=1 Tax=Sedimentibacter hydroxybenzoicus DSM 7310 TaxID=1123245 RepID=A0A974BJK6_SEDHY|nr:FMN-binding protein [Sedimentibacter hydroxybenzoicus]NYB74071.1 FMN-binding protein [Sedimentibacter hydroxybenzoicus DSM 7310]
MKNNNIVRLGGILCLISAIAAGVLAFTNDFTKDKIAEVELKASLDPAVLEMVMPGSDTFLPYEDTALIDTIKAENGKFVDLMVPVDGSGNQMGYAIKTLSTVAGFGGDIELFIGVSPEGKITGIAVTQILETAGLGTKVAEPAFKDQFTGKDLNAEITESDVNMISGATISSKSFTSAVSNAVNIYSQYLNK